MAVGAEGNSRLRSTGTPGADPFRTIRLQLLICFSLLAGVFIARLLPLPTVKFLALEEDPSFWLTLPLGLAFSLVWLVLLESIRIMTGRKPLEPILPAVTALQGSLRVLGLVYICFAAATATVETVFLPQSQSIDLMAMLIYVTPVMIGSLHLSHINLMNIFKQGLATPAYDTRLALDTLNQEVQP